MRGVEDEKQNVCMDLIIDISNKKWMSETEAVAYTTISRDTLRWFRDSHQLPYLRFGKHIKYRKTDLDDMMEKLEHHTNGRVRKTKLKMRDDNFRL